MLKARPRRTAEGVRNWRFSAAGLLILDDDDDDDDDGDDGDGNEDANENNDASRLPGQCYGMDEIEYFSMEAEDMNAEWDEALQRFDDMVEAEKRVKERRQWVDEVTAGWWEGIEDLIRNVAVS